MADVITPKLNIDSQDLEGQVKALQSLFDMVAGTVEASKAVVADSAGAVTFLGVRQAPVLLAADDTTLTLLAADSGKVHLIPDLAATSTATLPAAVAGLCYEFVYVGAAADAHDFKLVPTAGVFKGGLLHADVGGTTAAVYSNGTSNDVLTIVTPAAGTRFFVISDGTDWYLSGYTSSATIASLADA
jgi:hypothetical protein